MAALPISLPDAMDAVDRKDSAGHVARMILGIFRISQVDPGVGMCTWFSTGFSTGFSSGFTGSG